MLLPPYISAQCLSTDNIVRHGFFTRRGGVSTGIYASLNCGLGSGDVPKNIVQNRARVVAALHIDALAGVHQVHGRAVHLIATAQDAALRPHADGLVTRLPGIGLSVLSADCAPILFADAEAGIIGAAHAGWKGALAGVTDAVIEAMIALGARRDAISAAIGPCISQAAYEVGEDFRQNYLAHDPAGAQFFMRPQNSAKPHFDLPGYVAHRLRRAAIATVTPLDLCTYADAARFFSFRRATHRGEEDYGREISVIALAE